MVVLKAFTTIALMAVSAAAQTPAVWVVGDSTASNVNLRGWGDPFAGYFDQEKAHTVNRARAGRSSRTFLTEGLWEKVRSELKPGDYVLLQMGHNDGGPPDKDRARGSLPGLGEESQEFTLPNGNKEVVFTFGHYMRQFLAETKAAGARPILLGLTVRNIWKDGKVERGNGRYSQWLEELAKAAEVPFLDVTNAIADRYDTMGEAKVKEWFPEDHTHTSPAGADFNASMVVAALKGIDSPLVAFLSAKGQAVEPYLVAPQTVAPQTVAPQTAASQTVAAQTAASQTVAPQTAAPQTAAPQTAASQTVAPQTAASQTVAPQTAAPQTGLVPAPQTGRMRMPEPRDVALPTLFLIGDSTVRNGRGDGAGGQWGWGEPLVDRFDTNKVNVVNRAVGGLSSRTFLTLGHWERTLALMKPGDVVLMQFGHNDGGALDDASRARGTINGTGEDTREIDNPITKQHEVVHTYGWYLRKFIADTRARGATPVVCSLIPRKIWKDGKIARSDDSYGKWARDVAAQEKVGLVDLNEIVARKYDALGPEKVEPLFGDPHTHTSRAGAELNADSVVEGLKGLKDNPVAAYLK